MKTYIAQMLNKFESGKISRRQLIGSISMAAAALGTGRTAFAQDAAPPAARTKTDAQKAKIAELMDARGSAPFSAIQVSHFRYTCKDYKPARDFYQRVMGWHLVPGSDTGSQCTLAFYQKGVTPIGQPKGTPSGYVIMRNGWTAPTPAPTGSTTPKVVVNHIAYTVQFDKPLANGKVTWDEGSKGVKTGPLETMRDIPLRTPVGLRAVHGAVTTRS
jgi:catechol 2,3-dioxygenase-like lactoylglutathione lyase family enzyme